MFSIISLIIGFSFLGVNFFFLSKRGAEKLISTFSIFSVVYITSYFIIPAYSDLYEYSRYGLSYTSDAKYYALVFSSLLYIFICILYFLLSNKIPSISKVEFKKIKKNSLYFLGVICVLLCAFSLMKMISIIASYGLSSFLANRIVLTSGLGYFQLLLYLPLFWTIVFSIEKFFLLKERTVKKFIYGLIFVAISSLPLAVLGSRSNILFGIIIYLFSILLVTLKSSSIIEFKHKLKRTGLIVSLVILFGASLGDIRQRLMAEDQDNYVSEVKKMPFESVVTAFSSYENLYWFFSEGNTTNYQYGGSFISVILGPIPRTFWQSKPTGGGPIMKNHIAPGSYDLLAGDKISSYTTGFPTEAYLNFGWLGVILSPIIIVTIIMIHERFMIASCNSIDIVVSSALLLRIVGFVNAEFYGVFIHIFVILVFYSLYKILNFRRH